MEYFVEAATCVLPAKYVVSCSFCDLKGDRIFGYGDVDQFNHLHESETIYVFLNNEQHEAQLICLDCNKMTYSNVTAHIWDDNSCIKCKANKDNE
jgi:hypothetical protein